MTQIRPGLLIATIIFAIFAVYAYLATATYRTSAILVVDSSNSSSHALPEPLEAARRLSESILDRAMLERLSLERAQSSSPGARAEAAMAVRQALEIGTSDAHTFSISYRDVNPERAQRVCNQLAHYAAERAPLVLIDRSAERALEFKRQRQTQELAGFLALHPQVAAEGFDPARKPEERDLALSAFLAEKASLERRLLALEAGRGSDNPYLDAADSDPKILRRRLAEIEAALRARKTAIEEKPAADTLSPELRVEWKRLLDLVTASSEDTSAQATTLVAHVSSEAAKPGSPIDPNRPLLLFFGLVFGVGFGSTFTLVARATQQRRKSSRPPTATQAAQAVRVPPAPAVPTGIGLGQPASPVGTGSSAPIVPMPQRQISSSPPGPARAPVPAAVQKPDAAQVHATQVVAPEARSPALRPFASTLVLPPAQNPAAEAPTQDPVLASAERAWEEQIRAHAVPGFAVVRPGSEPPPVRDPSSASPPARVSSVPAPGTQRPASRPVNQMKVTQPLGSFIADGGWNDPSLTPGRAISSTPPAPPAPPAPPRSPMPPRSPLPQNARSSGAEASSYSYVSTPPPPTEHEILSVQTVSSGWAPDPRLVPAKRRPLCEQLYPLGVQSCFVVGVVAVPESIDQKSRVAAELALALADSGHPRILLLEGDFHRPSVQRLMRVQMPMSGGFSQQLRARIEGSPTKRWTVLSCTKTLHVLAEGFMRSPGLLLSQQFEDCMGDLRRFYDIIIIDGPTASLDLDGKALDSVIDGLLTVCPEQGSPALLSVQTLFGKKRLTAIAT